MSDTYHSKMSAEGFKAHEGLEIGVSRWFDMTQSRVDQFADCTEDWYFIHTNPARAAEETPWGGTIAHGFLTASLMSAMAYDCLPDVEGAVRGVNYGFDRLRFVAPVPVGGRVRGRFLLREANVAKEGEITLTYEVAVEIEGQEIAEGGKPAIASTWLVRSFFH